MSAARIRSIANPLQRNANSPESFSDRRTTTTALSTAWSRAPTPSVYSRSRAARRCRCCRGCSPRNSTTSSLKSRSCGRDQFRATWCIPICGGGKDTTRSSIPRRRWKNILQKTLGVPLFQEHAMRIAIVGAGFKPGEADRLRRAMATFKRVGTIDRFREKFIKGMIERGYEEKFTVELLETDRGLRQLRLSREPRREFRKPCLCFLLDEMPLSGCVRRRSAQQPADGLLRSVTDRARRSRSMASRYGRRM